MNLGISIGRAPENIDRIPEKYDFVELAVGEHEIPVEEINLQKLSQKLDEKDLDLIIHLPFRQPLATEIPEYNQATTKYFEQIIEKIQKETPVEKAVVHANLRDKESKQEKEKVKDQITKLQKIGQKHRVEICFENVGQFEGLELFEIGEILDQKEASMCFDTGHAYAEKGEEKMIEFLGEYSHIIKHLHVQDTREAEDLHLPIGVGQIDFKKISKKLENFKGTACLEIFTDDSDYLELSREKFLENF